MTVRFVPTVSDFKSLQAKAASGRSGVARASQAELERLITAALVRGVKAQGKPVSPLLEGAAP